MDWNDVHYQPLKPPASNASPNSQEEIQTVRVNIAADDKYTCPLIEHSKKVGLYARLCNEVRTLRRESRQTERYVVGVQTDRATSYEAYFEMQNTIVAAFHALREKMALQRYGHHFSQCTPEEREVIIKRYPLRISEAKPTQEGGSQ